MKFIQKFIISTLILLASNSFAQQTTTATPKATASLSSTCSISSSDANFGDITNPTKDVTTISVPLKVLCSNNVSYRIYQGLGTYGNQTTGRIMRGVSKGDSVWYFICKTGSLNAANNQCVSTWFNSDNIAGVGNGTIQSIPVYFMVWGSYATPDNYVDQTTTTITF